MSGRNKLVIVSVVFLAVLLIVLFTKTDLFLPMEGERVDTVEIEDSGELADTAEATDAEFEPDDDPLAAYREARARNKPVVLEFYARW